MSVNFKVSKADQVLIDKIVRRIFSDGLQYDDALSVEMDITACHANGTPLDLQKLLDAPAGDFVHDVAGIARHLNRSTGKIENFFLPRSYRSRVEQSMMEAR